MQTFSLDGNLSIANTIARKIAAISQYTEAAFKIGALKRFAISLGKHLC